MIFSLGMRKAASFLCHIHCCYRIPGSFPCGLVHQERLLSHWVAGEMCHKLNSREGEEVGAGYKDMGLEEGESPEGAYLKRRMKDKIWGNWGDWGGGHLEEAGG